MSMEDGGEVPEQLFEVCKELHTTYHHAICDQCDYPILGVRWKCSNCADYDLCAGCEKEHSKSFAFHPASHFFLKIERPLTERELWLQQFPRDVLASPDDVELNSLVHRGAFCSLCKLPIVGVRFVCTNCVSMYQLCETCDSRQTNHTNPHGEDNHFNGRDHVFLKVPFVVSHQVETRQAPRELRSQGVCPPVCLDESSSNSSSSDGEASGGMQLSLNWSFFESPPRGSQEEEAQTDFSGRRVIFSANPDDPLFPLYSVAYAPSSSSENLPAIVATPVRKAHYQLLKSSGANRELSIVCVREMEFNDLPRIMEIEQSSFSSPYHQSFFERMLTRGNYLCWVSMVEDSKTGEVLGIGGYICLRKTSDEWMDVVSVAVSPQCRGCGVGSSLLNLITSVGEAYSIQNCKLHVSVYNEPALRLYKKIGFVPAVWITRYYAEENEDAIVMHKTITTDE